MKLKIKKLKPTAKLPTYGTVYAAGADLYADEENDLIIMPHSTNLIHTSLAMEIPEGYVGLIYARSGLATKRHLAPANKVGVIDSDYRGEIMVALHNHSNEPQKIEKNERIAQIIITPCLHVDFIVDDNLTETERDAGGFGSTGKI